MSDPSPNGPSLRQVDLDNIVEIRRLLWEAMDHYTSDPDASWKSQEGAVSLHFPNYFEAESSVWVEVYSYAFGPHRHHQFASTQEALSEVRKWHAAEMARCYACNQAHAGDCEPEDWDA